MSNAIESLGKELKRGGKKVEKGTKRIGRQVGSAFAFSFQPDLSEDEFTEPGESSASLAARQADAERKRRSSAFGRASTILSGGGNRILR